MLTLISRLVSTAVESSATLQKHLCTVQMRGQRSPMNGRARISIINMSVTSGSPRASEVHVLVVAANSTVRRDMVGRMLRIRSLS